MKAAKIITWLGLGAMTFGLVNGFLNGDFMKDGKELLENPWGVMSLIDLYVGFTLFAMWIFYRERNILKSILWTLLLLVLGFFTACVYVLMALYSAHGNWDVFFKGRKER